MMARARHRMFAPSALVAWAVAMVLLAASPALALKPIIVDPAQDRIEITTLGDLYESHSDSLQVETAAGADGTTDRVSVPATTAGTSPNWMVFALSNPTDTAIERWITADRYTVVGSGAIWPDLDARRIEAVTPTMGFAAERIKSDRADVFRITIEPKQTITYVVELASDRFARINLWKPLEYELKVRDRQLFNGIILGLMGLLAIFLTAIFAANHKLIFPAAALVAWCVLANLCVDFGFFHKLFQLRPEDNAVYRAAAEAALASSLLIFVHTFLRLALWSGLMRMIITVWMVAQLSLIALAVIDPRLAATFARLSFVGLGLGGSAVILFLTLRGQDRAFSLVAPWVMFCVWLFGAAMVLSGRVSGEIAVSFMVAGLALVLLLIGFAVTQFAFRSREAGMAIAPSEMQMRALALDGAGAGFWEWNARRDSVKVGTVIEDILDLSPGQLSSKAEEFIGYLHPADRERFRLMLWSIQERAGGKIRTDVRLRHSDNSYRWFEIEAASVPGDDDRQIRCVGLIRDVTDAKRSQESLLHDAVHDRLTELPNRSLFTDRLQTALLRAKGDRTIRPTLFFIDVDKFKTVNASFGLVIGDSLLRTVSRRLQRHLMPQDTLARVGGDQFAILSLLDQDAQELASLAERVRRSLRAPIKMAGQDIVLTASVGVAVFNPAEGEQDLLKDAEIAMYRAKRGGADRIEIFKPEMRGDLTERKKLEADLRQAVERNQLKVFYQAIYYLPTEELAGFEAQLRWEHPTLGLISPAAFVSDEEDKELAVKLGSLVLKQASRDVASWQREVPRAEAPLFVSVNISSAHVFRQFLVPEVRHILGQNLVPPGSLKLEVAEALVMQNPEQAAEILKQLRDAGADLSLDEFGTGYSSLAYLNRFAFDTIKLSRALVEAGGAHDGDSAAVVRSIIAMAKELNKKVIADGVEADEDTAFLRSLGCEFAQGYYYGDPVPDYGVLDMLKRVRTSERRMRPRGLRKSRKRRERDAAQAPAAATVPMAAAVAARSANGARPNGQAAGSRPAGAPPQPSATRSRNGLLPEPPGGDNRARVAGAVANGGGAAGALPIRPLTAASGAPPPIPDANGSGVAGRAAPAGAVAGNGANRDAARAAMPPSTPSQQPEQPASLRSTRPAFQPAPGDAATPPPMPPPGRSAPQVVVPPPSAIRPDLAAAEIRPAQPPPAAPRPVEPIAAPPQFASRAEPQPPPVRPASMPVPPVSPGAASSHGVVAGQPPGSVTPRHEPAVPGPPPMRRSLPFSPGSNGSGPGAEPPQPAPPPIPAAAFAPVPGAPQPPPGAPPQVPPAAVRPAMPQADFSKLPPAIAESLARLAGVDLPPRDK